MQDHEQALVVYLKLAVVSRRKRQDSGAQRFLSLAAVAATEAALLEIAAGCRKRILELNPRNYVGRFSTLPDALRHADATPWRNHLERFCSFEQAEHLLQNHRSAFSEIDQLPDSETRAKALLNDDCWNV